MTVFITRKLPDELLQPFREAGIGYTQWPEQYKIPQDELIHHCKQHDAVLGAGGIVMNADFLNACSHLRVIALMSVGYDNVDIATATRLGIPVSNTPGVLSKATAETAFLLMIAAARKAFYLHRKIVQGSWHTFDPFADLGIGLEGATLGIFGLGSIGYEMAKRCKAAYDMAIIYHNRSTNKKAEEELGAKSVSFEELLQQSDVLSIHAALTAETRGKFNKTAFSQMKKNAIFINTARGALHNEQDLTTAIQEGTIWGAGLDVTNPEPMDKNNPLLYLPTVAVLPHIGSATVKTRYAMARLAVNNAIAGLHGQHLPQIVNKEVYER